MLNGVNQWSKVKERIGEMPYGSSTPGARKRPAVLLASIQQRMNLGNWELRNKGVVKSVLRMGSAHKKGLPAGWRCKLSHLSNFF